MLGPYYYILSSLPYLDLKVSNKYSISKFFNNISVLLKEDDFNFLKNLESGKFEVGKSGVIDSLTNFEETLRHTLAYIRAEKLGIPRDTYAESPYFSSYYLSILKSIASKDNPFEVELGFDMLKWQYLSDLEVRHDFDFEKLVIYFLKLIIVARRNLFEEKLGRDNFDLICENLIREISQKV